MTGDTGKCLQIREKVLLITSLLFDVGVRNALLSRVLGAHGRSGTGPAEHWVWKRESI